MDNQNTQEQTSYDISIVRPQMSNADFKMRGQGMEPVRLEAIKKGLLTLHTLELMAMTIYRFQITSENCDLNRELIAAMCNEMTHYQDFQIKLYEYGFKPSIIRLSSLNFCFYSLLLLFYQGHQTILSYGNGA